MCYLSLSFKFLFRLYFVDLDLLINKKIIILILE